MSSSPYIVSRKSAPASTVVGVIGAALLSGASLSIANASEPQEGDVDDAGNRRLGTVEVEGSAISQATSPKYTAPLLDTPKTVTVVPASVIEGTAATTLIEALRTVPGITFGAGEGGNPVADRPFIRGVDSATDIFVDGIRDTGSQSRESFAIDSIEVSKGPSSAFGGRGSAGGSINLVTKTPFAQDAISGSVGLGSDSYRRATVDINQVLSDQVALRVNLLTHDANVPGRNGPDSNRVGFAPSITFGMDSPTKATLSYYHLKSDEMPDTGIPYNNPFTSGPNTSLNGDGRPVDVPRDTFYGLFDRDFRKTQVDSGFIRIEHEFESGLTLRNTTGYAHSTNDYIWTQPDDSKGNVVLTGTVWRRANTRVSSTNSASNQTDLSGEFMTGALRHHFATGIELSHEQNERGSYVVDHSTRNPGSAAFDPLVRYTLCPVRNGADIYTCTSLANPNPNDPWAGSIFRSNASTETNASTRSAYAFDTIDLSERWLLNLGVRFDDYSTRAVTPTYVSNTGTDTGETVPALRLGNDASFWNYQAGLIYKPVENASIYASYATSSTPPGNNVGDGRENLSAAIKDLAPERSKSFEFGAKWDVLEGRLALTAAIFRTDKANARVTIDGGTTANAGDERVDGVEVGVSGNITKNWKVFAGYTWLDAVLVDAGKVLVDGVYVDSPNNGNQFANTPSNSASVYTTYQLSHDLSIGFGAYAMDRVYGNVANTKFVPGYVRYDAMAAYRINEHLGLQLNIQNLGDKTYFDKAYASHYASVAPGRSATLTASINF